MDRYTVFPDKTITAPEQVSDRFLELGIETFIGACRFVHELPYVPMIHCYLMYGDHRVDLTEGNHNGKRCAIDTFLYTEQVIPAISAKDEYLLYRKALKTSILNRGELSGKDMKDILLAREAGLGLLKANL